MGTFSTVPDFGRTILGFEYGAGSSIHSERGIGNILVVNNASMTEGALAMAASYKSC